MTRKCPNCGERDTTIDPDEGTILGSPIEDFIFNSEDGDTIGVDLFCWSCGWEQHKTVKTEVN